MGKSHLVSGKLVLVVLLVGAALMPLCVWLMLRSVQSRLAVGTPPLSWSDRASWPSPPALRITLEKSPGPYRHGTGRWRDLDFQISPQHAAAIEACREADIRELERLATENADFFYPPYLLGTRHRLAGNGTEAQRRYERAFALAPAVIKLRYIDFAGEPVADLELGTVEIAFDRVVDDELDQTLKLTYPDLATDERGFIYLPVYQTVCRASVLPEPAGYLIRYRTDGWFRFPGRIGTLKPAVVQRREHGVAKGVSSNK